MTKRNDNWPVLLPAVVNLSFPDNYAALHECARESVCFQRKAFAAFGVRLLDFPGSGFLIGFGFGSARIAIRSSRLRSGSPVKRKTCLELEK